MSAQPSNPVPGRIGIVGVIASAGGLSAITTIVRDLPANFPAPVVVFQHLSSNGSQLAELLAKVTKMPVSWALDGERVIPGEIKVCPVRMRMEIMPDGSVGLSE